MLNEHEYYELQSHGGSTTLNDNYLLTFSEAVTCMALCAQLSFTLDFWM